MANLFERIKDTVRRLRSAEYQLSSKIPGVPEAEEKPEPTVPLETGYIPQAQHASAIIWAAKSRRLVYILYNNIWRHVESYRFSQGNKGILYYGFCLVHNKTHSYYLHKIQELYVTDIPYVPRWPVEL